jgi:DNA-directed RNA polymerase II subunit RPB2
LVKTLKIYKTQHIIHTETSVVWDYVDKEVRINTDSGRPLRPVFVLKDGIPVIKKEDLSLSWDEMIHNGIITHIDPSESSYNTVACSLCEVYSAMRKGKHYFDYAEIHPSIIIGIASGVIPLPDHSQAPRNVFGSSMVKQGQSACGYNFNVKFETTSYSHNYPQKQLCKTTASEIIGHEELPSGINAIVAIGEGDGFNQEDSVIVNKSAIERGMLRTIIYHSYSVTEKRSGTKHSEIIKIPHKEIMSHLKNYNKLDKDGIIFEGSPVEPGDVLVGKVITNGEEVIDASHVVKTGEGGVVDRVMINWSVGAPRGYAIYCKGWHLARYYSPSPSNPKSYDY